MIVMVVGGGGAAHPDAVAGDDEEPIAEAFLLVLRHAADVRQHLLVQPTQDTEIE